MGKIILKDIGIYAYHGCLEEESQIGSLYELDVWVEGDFSNAEQSDSLNETVDYVVLSDLIRFQMLIRSKLIEHVANRIVTEIFQHWSIIMKVGLTIKKITPPMNTHVKSVCYTIERTRD